MGSGQQSGLIFRDNDRKYLRFLDGTIPEDAVITAYPGPDTEDGSLDLKVTRHAECVDDYQLAYGPDLIRLTATPCDGAKVTTSYPLTSHEQELAFAALRKYDRRIATASADQWSETVRFVGSSSEEQNRLAVMDPVYDPLTSFWKEINRLGTERADALRSTTEAALGALQKERATPQDYVGRSLEEVTFNAFRSYHLTPVIDAHSLRQWGTYFRLGAPADETATIFLTPHEAQEAIKSPAEKFQAWLKSPHRLTKDGLRLQAEYNAAATQLTESHPDPVLQKIIRESIDHSMGQVPADLLQGILDTETSTAAYRALYRSLATAPIGNMAATKLPAKDIATALHISVDLGVADNLFQNYFAQLLGDPAAQRSDFEAVRSAYVVLLFCKLRTVEASLQDSLTANDVSQWTQLFRDGFEENVVKPIAAIMKDKNSTPDIARQRIANLEKGLPLEQINKGLAPKETLFQSRVTGDNPDQTRAVAILKDSMVLTEEGSPYTYRHAWADAARARQILEKSVVGQVEAKWLRNLIFDFLNYANGDQLEMEPDARLEWLNFLETLEKPTHPFPDAAATVGAVATETSPAASKPSTDFNWLEAGISGAVAAGGIAGGLVARAQSKGDRPSNASFILLGAGGAAASNLLTQTALQFIAPAWSAEHPWTRRVSAVVGGGGLGVGLNFELPFGQTSAGHAAKPGTKPSGTNPPAADPDKRQPESAGGSYGD